MSTLLLHEYLAATAAGRGRDTALVFGAERVTFAELEAVSNQLADALIEAGCRPGDRVCLLAPKVPATIAAMLATLKAGCAYVPLDPASPSPRSAQIVEATEPAAVFLAPEAELLAAELRSAGALGESVACVTAADARGRSERPHPRRAAPGDPAHILFTSGSTGRP
jgi:acyl-CoA synthetase (AMP-forming)/AMP-acid ligase II